MSDWRSRAKPVDASNWRERAKPVQSEIPVEDAASNEISFADRAIAKNLAQSTTKQAEYLKQKYPNLDIKVQGNNVLVKAPNESSYKMLDPSSFELADITDMADVVGAGLASTAGTIVGGALGNVPGALAGTGLAGAAYEAARQKLGALAGIPQEVSAKDAAISGVANVAGAGLLGTGLKGRGAYEGAIRQAWNKGIPKFAESIYGAPAKVIAKYTDEKELVESAIPRKTEIAQDMVDKIRTALSGEKKKVGSALSSSIKNADEAVEIGPIIKSYDDMIARLEAEFSKFPSQINKSKLDEAIAQRSQLFGDITTDISGSLKVNPDTGLRLQGDIKDFGDLRRIGTGVNPRYGSSATQAEKELSDEALRGYQALNQQFDEITEGASPALKKQYQELMQMQSALSQGTNTPQQAYSTLTNLESGKSKTAFKEQLKKLANKTGLNLDDDVTTLQAAEYFGDAGWSPKSVGGTTSTSRTIPAALVGAGIGSTAAMSMGVSPFLGGAIGGGLGNVMASPAMLKGIINSTGLLRSGANALGRAYNPVVVPVREAIVQSPWDGM